MLLQYKEDDIIMPALDKCLFFDDNQIDNTIFEGCPDILDIIKNSVSSSVPIFENHGFSLEFCKIIFQLFISKDLTTDQKCILIDTLNTFIVKDVIEKNDFIFQLIFQIFMINDKSNKITDSICRCMLNLICSETIVNFPISFYDTILSTVNKIFICQIAQKASENLIMMKKSQKKIFILFLKNISKAHLDADTAFLIYTAHLNLFYMFPHMFPLLDLDFYIDGIKYDLDTQITILNILSRIRNYFGIFLNPQIQKVILFGISNQDSSQMMIQSMRALSNLLESNAEKFEKFFLDDVNFQKLISHLNDLILESSFSIKTDAGYLLSLLILNFPQSLFCNFCGNSTDDETFCDIREAMSIVFEIEQIALTIKLLYAFESIFLFASKSNFTDFITKINEYEILDKIDGLTENEKPEISSIAIIVSNEIKNMIENAK